MKALHVYCGSDKPQHNGNYAGLLVVSPGTFPAKEKCGRNIYPGYIILYDSQYFTGPSEGMVHGHVA